MTRDRPTDRTRVNRLPERGAYDRETVYSILDEGLVCHVGFAVGGKPFVIPMTYARVGDNLIVHGFGGGRLMKLLKSDEEICVVVTRLDALVLARSAFHHSMNYRSVVIFGRPRVIENTEAKLDSFREFFEHILPGRWKDVRKPTTRELAQTAVVEIPLDEASAKIRSGPPQDDEDDYNLPVWAGLIPFELNALTAQDDPKLGAGIKKPDYVRRYSRKPNG